MDYLSNIITDEDLEKISPGQFNVLRAPRGYGKTTFMFDDRVLKFSRAKKHVLYLINTSLLRNVIVANHSDKAVVFENKTQSGWFDRRSKKIFTEEDEDLIHVMCYQTFAALLRHEGTEWLDDIDLIIWDEFDDVKEYYERDIKKLSKVLPDFSRERLVALLEEGCPTSVINFIYRIKVDILDQGRIRLLAISATPENAAYYFKDYINYIFKGRLEERYAAEETIFIEDLVSAIKTDVISIGRKYWCFVRSIHDGFRVCSMASGKGFNPLMLWSRNNRDWSHLMTQERKEALDMIEKVGRVPEGYDFIVITAAGCRGINIYDTSFQDWICNSDEFEDLGQFIRARFPITRQYILESGRGVIDFIQNGFHIEYYNWHSLEELRKLIQEKPIFSKDIANRKRLTTFNAVKKEYPDLFESRKYGRSRLTQYRIKPAVQRALYFLCQFLV